MRRALLAPAVLTLLVVACGEEGAPGGSPERASESIPAPPPCDPALDSSMVMVVPPEHPDSMPVVQAEPTVPMPNPCADSAGLATPP